MKQSVSMSMLLVFAVLLFLVSNPINIILYPNIFKLNLNIHLELGIAFLALEIIFLIILLILSIKKMTAKQHVGVTTTADERVKKFANWLEGQGIFTEKKIDELINEVDEWCFSEKKDIKGRLTGIKVILATFAISPIVALGNVASVKSLINIFFSSMTLSNVWQLSLTTILMATVFASIYMLFDWSTVLLIGYTKKQKVRYMLKDAKYRL